MNTRAEYLGDGVYASFDGWHIVLDLRGQDNVTQISLDPTVWNALIEYQKSLVRDRQGVSTPDGEAD